ncbi:MAG: hypothetical protein AAF993_04695 [Pseudomonadota bacterium]
MPDWAESHPADGGRLTAAQIDSWRNQGFALVHDLLPVELLQQAAADAYEAFPQPGTSAAADISQFGSNQQFVFPAQSSACNQVTLHPHLLDAVAALLNVSVGTLRLTQSDLWPKYGRPPGQHDQDNAEQRIHCDYPNHTLTHPPPWSTPEAVEIIIYLSEHAACEGSTALVPRQGDDDPAYPWPIVDTPGVAGLPYINDRDSAEAYLAEKAPAAAAFRAEHLYAREVQARYQFGSVLFYRHDVWHRGTPVKDGALRLVHNLTFKKADSEWVNVLHPGWSWSMYRRSQRMEKLIAQASVEQRAVLGFPLPGSPYWQRATLDAVQARYGAHGIDMTPYER